MIDRELIGIYINPDEMELEMRDRGFLDFASYQVQTTKEEVLQFFSQAELLKQADLMDEVGYLHEIQYALGICFHFFYCAWIDVGT